MEKKLIQYHIKKFLFTESKWIDVLVNMDSWLAEGRRSVVLTAVRPNIGVPLIMGTGGGGIEPMSQDFYSRRDIGSVDPITSEICINDWGTNPCCEITLPIQTDY